METAISAETLDNFQLSTHLIPESKSITQNSSCKNLRTRSKLGINENKVLMRIFVPEKDVVTEANETNQG
jgi:hypothetical protein